MDSLDKTTSGAVVHKLKSHFARHGIPETCVSDNGPQFTSTEFKEFSRQWKFVHVTSSPAYLQRSGKVEAAVNSAKNVIGSQEKPEQIHISLSSNTETRLVRDWAPVQCSG